MLVGEGEGFDLQKVGDAEQAVEIDAQGMSGELGVQARAEAC